MNLFKGAHFPKDIILMAMRWYLAYPLSYRHVEELLLERGIKVDHATINRWVIRYSQDLERRFRRFKQKVGKNWYVDETYIKVKGQWVYYYRAVDQYNHTVDFYLSEKRDADAARRFFEQAIHHYHDFPNSVTLDNNPANLSGLAYVNYSIPKHVKIKVRQNKYLNNIIEQDHRAIKRITHPMLSFKAYQSAVTTLTGIEICHMIRKGQF